MHRQALIRLLSEYKPYFMDEAGFVQRALAFVRAHENCFDRQHLPVHVTGSAWVVNPPCSRVLMVHHGKHHQWFQPGGHADGDGDILRVALRETAEESGLDPSLIRLLGERIFDVDIHAIAAGHGCPAHHHIDIRFLVEIDDRHPVPGSDESHAVAWIDLHQVPAFNSNRSTYRMLEKTRRLKNTLRFKAIA